MSADASSHLPGPPPRSSLWRRAGTAFVSRAALLVPPIYLGILLALVPPDHFGPPEMFPKSGPILYDDWDYGALALRGLNAHFGRVAGRTDVPEDLEDAAFFRALDEDRRLAPRYNLEYPHASLLVFRLGYLLQPDPPRVPNAVLDASYGNINRHRPRNEAERGLWRCFRQATNIYRLVMGVCLVGLALVLRAGCEPDGQLASNGLLLLLPASLYYTFNRFDIVPALCTALSVAALGRRRPAVSGSFLAVGAMVKLYPVVLVPLFLRYLVSDRRSAARWVLAFGATVVLLLLPPLLGEGWEAVKAPYLNQLSRSGDAEPPWTAYGYILPHWLADNSAISRAFRAGSLMLAVALLAVPRMPDLASLLRRSAVALVVFMILPVFYSPQWIVWLSPFLLPLTRRHRGLAALVVALDLVTFFTFPLWWGGDVLGAVKVYARFVVLGVLALLLLWGERREPSPKAGWQPAA
jgi:hypothetical protein